jgi:uncharacterized cupredoxin-like copper-binding protein
VKNNLDTILKEKNKMVNIRRTLSLAVILLLLFALVPLALAQGGNPVEVTLIDGQIQMANSLPAGSTTFTVTNNGTKEHGFEVEGNGIEEELDPTLQPSENGTLTVDLQPGTYEVYCPVGNHRAEGMTMQLTVTAADPAALPATGGVLSPGAGILLLGLGVLILVAGLSLTFARRTR